jgi:endonuclease/exonuclease/phosphatase family metal-dependent hydrolase
MIRRRGLLVGLAGIVSAAAASARTRPSHLSMLAFNVLAPLWAAPVWYPAAMNPAVLDRTWRRERIVAFLRGVGRRHDVVALQEVELAEWPFLQRALGAEYAGAFAGHDRHYWSDWLVPQLPWAPNGNALFVRRSAVTELRFADLSLGGTGNHAALATGALAGSGRPFAAASVHLDSDSNRGRRIELQSLLSQWPASPNGLDLIAGDINEDTVTGSAAGLFQQGGFVDLLAAVGNREATHPFSASYNRSPRWAIIDHLMVRGAAPRAGDVFDSGVWSIADEVARIEANFEACGSDHFPVGGQVEI